MGINVLKWVYDLGVKHERRRIAAILRIEQAAGRQYQQNIYNGIDHRSSAPTQEAARVELDVALKVIQLIEYLFQPTGEKISTTSIMFPEEDKK